MEVSQCLLLDVDVVINLIMAYDLRWVASLET